MLNPTLIYELLGRLDSEAKVHGLRLLALAGQLGKVGQGSLFEIASADVLAQLAKTMVVDEAGNEIGVIPSPGDFVDVVLLGRDRRFDPEKNSYWMRTQVAPEQSLLLARLRCEFLENLRRRTKASSEYKALAVAMGAHVYRLSLEEVDALIQRCPPDEPTKQNRAEKGKGGKKKRKQGQ
jgi:hypothetical protein